MKSMVQYQREKRMLGNSLKFMKWVETNHPEILKKYNDFKLREVK